MYHVTTSNDVDSILENGLQSRGVPSYYSERYELDKAADTIGCELYTQWVSRVTAVYFWETKEQAIKETADVGTHYDRIIEVDSTQLSNPVWKLPTQTWEEAYRSAERPHNLTPDDDIWDTIESVLRQAKLDDGSRPGTNELWTTSPVSSNSIVEVHEIE